jgi:hypothetical protein
MYRFMNAETRIYIELNGQVHASAAVLLGKHFLLSPEQDRPLVQGTVWRFRIKGKTKECGAMGNRK